MEYKGYMVGIVPQSSMMQIKAKGQGKVPNALAGFYTSRGEAHKAIDGYLSSLLKGKNTNGKTTSVSTG